MPEKREVVALCALMLLYKISLTIIVTVVLLEVNIKKIFLIVIFLGLAYVLIVWFFLLYEPCDIPDWSDEIFEKDKWHIGGEKARYKYVNSLLSRNIKGLDYIEVKKLLGEPDYVEPKLMYVYYNIMIPMSVRNECDLFYAVALKLTLVSSYVDKVEIIYD